MILVHDVASGKAGILSTHDRLMYLKHHFIPDRKFPFSRMSGNKGKVFKLHFQHSWLEKCKWLVYSPSQQRAYCKYCVLFPQKNPRIKPGVLVSQPMQNFKKVMGKDGYLTVHEGLQYHKDAVLQGMNFCTSAENPEVTLPYKISIMNKEKYDKNFTILKSIVKGIILCGKQNVALRGHRDDYTSNSENKGYYIALLHHMAENNVVLREHLEHGKRNAMATSKTTQNEIISIIADYIRQEITKCLQQKSAVFSIIADEVTDKNANCWHFYLLLHLQ